MQGGFETKRSREAGHRHKLEKLLEPFHIGQMVVRNRVVMPAMGTSYASEAGEITEQGKQYYVERAKGGVGLVTVECTCVDASTGRHHLRGLFIDDDRYIPSLSQLANAIQREGAKAAIQLVHAGAVAKYVPPVAPSAVSLGKNALPRELTVGEIEQIITRFGEAAARAKKAGFDGIEIHAAHHYLIAEFLSRAWNKRQDEFGGSLKNRTRILVEVIRRMRESVGAGYPIWYRINGREYGVENGMSLEEAKEIALLTEEAGADAIHVTGFGFGQQVAANRPPAGSPWGIFVPLAEEIKQTVKIPVIVAGRINLDLGEKVVSEQKADFVAIGRPLIADPHLVRKTVQGKVNEIIPCIYCNVCGDRRDMDSSLYCSVNPSVGNESAYVSRPASKAKKVVIVGGGPAGMEAAIAATLKKHEVVLYEKETELGGQLVFAVKPPHKDETQPFLDYLVNRVRGLRLEVKLGQTFDIQELRLSKPEVVILATGVMPRVLEIHGAASNKLIEPEEVLMGKTTVGDRIVVIGGGLVGCETAEFLAEKGKKVTIVEMLDKAASKVGVSVRVRLLDRLAAKGVTILTGAECVEVTKEGPVIKSGAGPAQTIKADTIINATTPKPNKELFEGLKDKVPELYFVGDCVEPRRIKEAVNEGWQTGWAV